MRKVLFMFGQLNDDDIEWLLRNGRREAVEPGHVIITQGVPADAVYFVLSGAFSAGVAHSSAEVGRAGVGEILGELSFVDAGPPTATVRAVEPSEVLAVPRAALAERLATDDGCAARFYRGVAMFLADRLRGTIGSRERSDSRPLQQDPLEPDELDIAVLETLHLAGVRFERLVRGAGQAGAPAAQQRSHGPNGAAARP